MSVAVARKLSDRGAFAWGVVWTALVLGVLIFLGFLAFPLQNPVAVVLMFTGLVLSSVVSKPISQVDATLALGVGSAMYFVLYHSTTPETALLLWGAAFSVGRLVRLRHVGDAAEATAYGMGCVLVCTVALHFVNAETTAPILAALVCVVAFVAARLAMSFVRLAVVAAISVHDAMRALLPRRIFLMTAILVLAAALGYRLLQLIMASSTSSAMSGAGAVVIILFGAAAFAYSMSQESHILRTRLRGSLDAALALPWDPSIAVADHAREFAQRILPRHAVELRSHLERNIDEITAPIGDRYLVARRGASQPPFLIEDQQVLDAITHLASTMADARSEHRRLAQAAATDELTGLPNYRGFREALQQLDSAAGIGIAVGYVDIDGFKQVNDRYGHDVGNVVLKTVAGRMRINVAAEDVVARVGGDEFVVILLDVTGEAEARRRMTELAAAVTTPITLGKQVIPISVSYGIAMSNSADVDVAALVTQADQRMYEGRNLQLTVSPVASPLADAKPDALLASLARVMAECLVTFVYQPIVDAAENRIVAVEALVRPAPEEHQGITADLIVNEARRLGRLTELSIHMLESTTADMLRFQEVMPQLRGLHVNIDVEQIVEPAFVAKLTAPTCPGSIDVTLELGEVSVHRVTPDITAALERLRREHRVRVALDDFGRTSATLGAIADYPLDVLKVDKSLIARRDHPATWLMMKHLNALCEQLGATVVVEGVEDAQVAIELDRIGVHHRQGYYYSPALTPQEFLAQLSSRGLRATAAGEAARRS